MRIGSFLLSFLLHLTVLAVALLWPDSRPPVDLARPVYQVSLVMGDPGGENLASAVLGPRPPAAAEPGIPATLAAPAVPEAHQAAPELAAPSVTTAPPPQAEPAPQPASVPAALPAEQPVSVPQPPLPARQDAPQAPQEALPSRPVEIARAEQPERDNEMPRQPDPQPQPPREPEKKPETPPEQPKPEDKPKPEEPKQPQPEPPKPAPPRTSAAASALADLQKQSNRGSAASRALADLEKQSGNTGAGGGGGVGGGPGGGGLYDVYVGQVMLLVQSHWSLPTYSRENLVVQVRIIQDASGTVQDCRIVRSSGRHDVDASAVNAVLRARQLPPPPTPEQQELIITFNTQDMGGR